MKRYWTKEAQRAIMTVFLLLLSALLQHCNSQDGFQCCDGTVRLAGGSLSNEGRVEICRSGQWKTVCDNNWSQNEARVVCRQLGYTTQGAVPLIDATFGRGTGTIVEQVRCNGTERGVAECTMRDVPDGECNHNEDAGVRCSCQNGDVRLEGSTILGRGRVEVCINDVWGTICDNFWSSADANVICGQLGFSRFGAIAYCCARDGQGSGPIHMSNVGCRGHELSLSGCTHATNHNCHHREDASVQCRTRIVCHDGDVRLVGGRQPYEGRVEVCFNETWGTICNHISPWGWNVSEADVVCKQLGYSAATYSTFRFGDGNLPVFIAYVDCKGTESSIANCTYSTESSSITRCLRYNDGRVGVQCRSNMIVNGTVRLTDGLTQYEGAVEVYLNSQWRSVCYDGWDELDAKVVCREINYLSTSVEVKALSYGLLESKRRSITLKDVGCSGLEGNITNCCATKITTSLSCHSASYAGVRCAQCSENSIQLIGELSHNEGVVAICLGGSWGKVCGGNINAATVICRQLGLSIVAPGIYDQRILYDSYGSAGLPNLIRSVQCTSHETQLSQCSFRTHSQLYCSSLGIKCQVTNESIPGAPQNVQVTNATSSTLAMSWSPPLKLVSERYSPGLQIFSYMINCTTGQDLLESAITYTDALNATLSNLHPFTAYNCCVAANSNHGRGKPACQSTITWDQFYLYNGTPTRVQSLLLNETALLLSWHSPDALHTNGIIEEYHVQVTDDDTGGQTSRVYTTEDTHLLINNLKPGSQYSFRVAAYAGEIEQFSQPLIIRTSNSTVRKEIVDEDVMCTRRGNSLNQWQLVISLASILGLISFALLITIIIVVIYICCRVCKRDNKLERSPQVQIYEIVDVPSQQDDSGCKPEGLLHKHGNVSIEQLTMKQEQAKGIPYLPHEYLTPTLTTFDQRARPGPAVATDEENTYQPLIPPRFRAVGDEKSEYQSLTPKNKTFPAKFGMSPIGIGPAPPVIPPKPKAM